jgi:uncharacterized protein (TIGR02453 family)
MSEFRGFGKQALPFFKALAFHQSKAWFEENRAIYERDVVEPMLALLDDLNARFAKKKIPLKANGKKSIFRLHRDIRFSKDKSPYKTHSGAVLTRTGEKMSGSGLLYLHIDATGSFAAAGFYMPEPANLAKMRKAIAAPKKKFGDLLKALKKDGLELDDYAQLTRVPRGFEKLKDGPLDSAIRMKSFTVDEALPVKLLSSAKLPDALVDFTERAMPLLKFGWAAMD